MAGDQVVARAGRADAVGTRGDVVELLGTRGAGCHGVDGRQRLGKAVQRGLVGGGASLVRQGDERRPLRSARTGAAEDVVPAVAAVGIVDRETAVRVGVVGDVGVRPPRVTQATLITGLGLVAADAAPSAAPADLPGPVIVAVVGERRATDGEHVGGYCRIGLIAAVAGREDERNPTGAEMAVVARLTAEFAAPPAIGDHGGTMADRVTRRRRAGR